MTRPRRALHFPYPLGVRLDERTRRALADAAFERGVADTALARWLIARGLNVVDTEAPVRRRPSPVRDAVLMRDALHLLGEVGGNLQRTYVALSARGRSDDDLLAIKATLRAIADRLRDALRPGDTA